MEILRCPVCSSENAFELEPLKRGQDLGFGVSFFVETYSHICNDCGFEGAFNDEADRKYEKAFSIAHTKLIQVVSDRLRSIGSDTEIERALHLFPRTLKKWREAKEFSYTATALFRILAKYPHILDSELRSFRKKNLKAASIVD